MKYSYSLVVLACIFMASMAYGTDIDSLLALNADSLIAAKMISLWDSLEIQANRTLDSLEAAKHPNYEQICLVRYTIGLYEEEKKEARFKLIRLNMTDTQIEDLLGWPDDKNKTTGSWGIHEQWIYGEKYLYFENGILKSWQE